MLIESSLARVSHVIYMIKGAGLNTKDKSDYPKIFDWISFYNDSLYEF